MYSIYQSLRDSRGMKDADVVRETGIGQGVFSDWKKGRYTPKTDKLQRIADLFDVSVEYLTTGKDSEKKSDSGKSYYFSDETAEAAQELFDDPDLRILFDAAKDSRPENLRLAAEMLRRMKETNPDG